MSNKGLVFTGVKPSSTTNRINVGTPPPNEGRLFDVSDIAYTQLDPSSAVKNKDTTFERQIPRVVKRGVLTNNSLAFDISSDGVYLFTANNNSVHRYTLTTPWDVSTATGAVTKTFSALGLAEATNRGVALSANGKILSINGSTYNGVTEFVLANPYDIGNAATSVATVSIPNSSAGPLQFNNDGTKVYAFTANTTVDSICELTLGTAYKPTTYTAISNTTSAPITGSALNNQFLGFHVANNYFYYAPYFTSLISGVDIPIFVTAMSNTQSISNTSFVYIGEVSTKDLFSTSGPTGVANNAYLVGGPIYDFKIRTASDGKVYGYFLQGTSRIFQVELPGGNFEPYQVDSNFSYLRAVQQSSGLFFKADGTAMYVTDTLYDRVFQYDLATAWNVTTASLSRTRDTLLPTAEGSVSAITFSPDGTKMYLAGKDADTIYQYTLSTAWDIDTATYANKSVYIGGREQTITGISFNETGSLLYLVGTTGDLISQYFVSTPYDISTAAPPFFASDYDTSTQGIFVKSDGLRVYTIGATNDKIYQFDMSTAFDLRTVSANGSFTLNSYQTNPKNITFSNTGTIVYLLDTTAKTIYGHTLGTAWDITTTNSTPSSFRYISEEATPTTFTFNSDGTRLFVSGTTNTNINEYALTTAWDLFTARALNLGVSMPHLTYVGAGTVLEITPSDIAFSNTGLDMYLLGQTNDRITQIPLEVAWEPASAVRLYNDITSGILPTTGHFINKTAGGTKMFAAVGSATAGTIYQFTLQKVEDVTTAIYDGVSYVAGTEGVQAIWFKSDGTRMYTAGTSTDAIAQFDLSIPWNLSSVTANGSFSIAAVETSPTGLFMNPDGLTAYVIGAADRVYEIGLRTAWDITTAYVSGRYINTQNGTLTGVSFSSDGSKMFLVGSANAADDVSEYSLTVPWLIGTASFTANTPAVSAVAGTSEGTPTDVIFKTDGTKFYTTGQAGDTIIQYDTSTAWSLVGATPVGAYSILARDTSSTGLYIKPDGTKMYVIGTTNDTVYQHTLSTPWQINTATYDTKSFSVTTQDATPNGLSFSTDGTKMYMVGSTSDAIYEYNLSTAWDVSTASLSASKSISPISTSPGGLYFKSDGTSFFIADTASVFEWKMSTPWSVATAYSTFAFSGSTQSTTLTGLDFTSNGSLMYLTSTTAVYQYDLAVPWRPGSATYANKTYTINTGEANARRALVSSNGSFVTISGNTKTGIIYKLPLSTPYDISTASFTDYNTIALSDTIGTGLAFTSNGSVLYVVGQSTDTVYRYNLSTPWNLSTASVAETKALTSYGAADPTSVFVTDDGTSLFIGSSVTANNIQRLRMSTPNSLATLTGPRWQANTNMANDTSPEEVRFSADGTKMYVLAGATDTIYQFALSNAWEPTTATANGTLSVTTQETLPAGFALSDDGTKLYVVGTTSDTVFQYTLGTAWDITTASYASLSVSVTAQESTPQSVAFSNTGTAMYIVGTSSDAIRQYTLSTAWNVSTATYSNKTFSISGQETNCTGLHFKPDGSRMFIVGTINDTVKGYDLSTPWDVSTATYNSALDKLLNAFIDSTPSGITFKSDGSIMYVIGTTNDLIWKYDLPTAWNPSTATIDFAVVGEVNPAVNFSSNGLIMNIAGSGSDSILSYNLNPAYAIHSATLATNTSVAGFDTVVNGMTTTPSGNSIFLISGTSIATSKLTKLVLKTDWLPATLSGKLTLPDTSPQGIRLSANNTTFILLGDTNNALYSYTMPASRPSLATQANSYTLATAATFTGLDVTSTGYVVTETTTGSVGAYFAPTPWSFTGTQPKYEYSVASVETATEGIFVKPDGLAMFIVGSDMDKVVKYTLSTAHDLGTMSYTSNVSVATETTDATDLFFKSDGTKMYILALTNKAVYPYTLSTAWDITTAVYDGASYDVQNITESAYSSIKLSPDGSYLYVTGSALNKVYRFTLSTPFAISSISNVYQTLDVSSYSSVTTALEISRDGSVLLVGSDAPTGNAIHMYALGTPWDLTTASYSTVYANATYTANTTGIHYGNDGKTLYVTSAIGSANTKLNSFTLPTRWSVSGMTIRTNPVNGVVMSSNVSSGNTFQIGVSDFAILKTGDYGYFVRANTTNSNTYTVFHYRSMNIPGIANTLPVSDTTVNLPLTLGNTTPLRAGGIALKQDATKMWVVDNAAYRVYEFNLKS